MKTLLLLAGGLLLAAEGVTAQESYRSRAKEAADALREQLVCPTDVAWPELPTEGRRTFRIAQLDSTRTVATYPAAEDSSRFERPDVVIPQYAFYYHSQPGKTPECIPVIIVQAEGDSFGWLPAREPAPAAIGAASDAFFDLLGTEPPQR